MAKKRKPRITVRVREADGPPVDIDAFARSYLAEVIRVAGRRPHGDGERRDGKMGKPGVVPIRRSGP